MKAYHVNAAERRIEPVDYQDGTGFKQWLPSGICIGWTFSSRDVLYVDDECLLRPAKVAFRIRGRPDGQPMMSDGILTGRDHGDTTLDPRMSLAELAAEIEWLELPDALAWFRAMAEQPAVTSTLRGETIVHARWAEFLRNLEGGPVYRPADDDGLVRRM